MGIDIARLRFTIRPVSSLPWPEGLGKSEYRGLELRMKKLLGNSYANPDAHRDGMNNNADYRRIVDEELSQERWAGNLKTVVEAATDLARRAPLLDQPLSDASPWREWTYSRRDEHGFPIYAWLSGPPNVVGPKLADGRHRLTYLRLLVEPDFNVLVKVTRHI